MKKVLPEEKKIETKKGHKIFIVKDFCKSCRICVRFCPTQTLGLGEDLKVEVINPNNCIGCLLCEILCPDFAIAVEKKKRKDG
ncbi:MAG: 4Fe-4S binding protein [candidate division WOR-3 bacterium]